MTDSKRVVVTGVGVVSAIGNNKNDFWEALKRGDCGIDRITSFDSSPFYSNIAGEVKNFDPAQYLDHKTIRHSEKFVHFAVAGSKMAMQDSGIKLDTENLDRIGVLIGSGIGSLRIMEEQYDVLKTRGPKRLNPFMIPMLIVNIASGQVAIEFGLKGPNLCITTACAAASHAIGEAYKIIQRQDADIMVTGGTESCITQLGVGGFCALKALSARNDEPKKASRPFDLNRDGFVMAEGCGILMLEELEHAKKRGANIYCELVGYAANCDAYHITAPDPCADGTSKCIINALKDAKINPKQVDYINAHGTSTKLNDKTETLAIKIAFKEHAKTLMVNSTKSMTGHTLGAAGGVEAVACALSIKEEIIHPTINYSDPDPDCDLDYVPNETRKHKINYAMSNSFGFGGHNATIVFKRFE